MNNLLIAVPLVVGGLSGYLTKDADRNYYKRPSFSPPGALVGPVWIVLYLLMGVSLKMVSGQPGNQTALTIFYIQLALNFMWSIVFFNAQRPDMSLVIILAMAALILYMIILFRRIKPNAGYLQIPYLLWVLFATVVNVAIVRLN